MTDLLSHLREYCHSSHDALHTHPLLKPLHSGSITIEHYKLVIAAFYMAYEFPENNLLSIDLPDNPVLDWLKQDIDYLNVTLVVRPLLKPIELDDLSAKIGYLYVKQGSSLGGQMISRHLAKELNLDHEKGGRFFYGEGKKTGLRWQEFKHKVNLLQVEADAGIAAKNALSMFGNIRTCCDYMLGILNENTPATD